MPRAACHHDFKVETAETPCPDTRGSAAVETQHVAFDQLLFGKITHTGIEAALLVGAKQQVRVQGEGQVCDRCRTQGHEGRDHRALHVGRAACHQLFANLPELEWIAAPAITRRHDVGMEVEAADRPPFPTPADEVDPWSAGRTMRRSAEKLRHAHTLKRESQRRKQAFQCVGKWRIAIAWRKGCVERDQMCEFSDPGLRITIDHLSSGVECMCGHISSKMREATNIALASCSRSWIYTLYLSSVSADETGSVISAR